MKSLCNGRKIHFFEWLIEPDDISLFFYFVVVVCLFIFWLTFDIFQKGIILSFYHCFYVEEQKNRLLSNIFCDEVLLPPPPNSCKYWLIIKYIIFLYSIILVEHSISHSKAQFSLGVNCANPDSVSYCTILNINIIDIPLKCFQIKIRKIGHNISLIIILLNAVGGNWA